MTALIAGVDLSTKELTAALIPLDQDHGDPACPPVQFRAEPLGKTNHLGTRYRDIHHATRALLTLGVKGEVVLVIVEEPRGPFATRQLSGVFGAVLASVPGHMMADYIDPQAWWRELGMPKTRTRKERKSKSITAATDWMLHQAPIERTPGGVPIKRAVAPDEHKAEALLVALAGRQQNNRAFAA